jgi:phosphate:Na+ symporter
MISSFAASGIVDFSPSMAVMLGANVGTALIVQILSFNSSIISPVLLFIGMIAFKRASSTRARDLGKVSIGLGLMLLSLHLLLTSLTPAENAPLAHELLKSITGEPVLNLIIGTLLAWAAHSSVATVLMVMSLAFSNFITVPAAFALVLGANLGSAINPLLEGGVSDNPAARRLPVANLLNRALGVAIFIPAIPWLNYLLLKYEPNPIRAIADFHILFNIVMAILFILPLGWIAKILETFFPNKKPIQSLDTPIYLDESVIELPSIGLACAARESLRMGDIVETMLKKSMMAIFTNDRKIIPEISRLDDAVDNLYKAIKLYVIRLTRDSLDEGEGSRAAEILAFVINLEHIGDIIDKNMMEIANKKIKRQAEFSPEGASELEEFQKIIIENLKLSFNIFLSSDAKLATKLLEEKVRIRELEMRATESHFARLKGGRIESIETSSLHLDLLRDLKRINYHINAAAYPVLEASKAALKHAT